MNVLTLKSTLPKYSPQTQYQPKSPPNKVMGRPYCPSCNQTFYPNFFYKFFSLLQISSSMNLFHLPFCFRCDLCVEYPFFSLQYSITSLILHKIVLKHSKPKLRASTKRKELQDQTTCPIVVISYVYNKCRTLRLMQQKYRKTCFQSKDYRDIGRKCTLMVIIQIVEGPHTLLYHLSLQQYIEQCKNHFQSFKDSSDMDVKTKSIACSYIRDLSQKSSGSLLKNALKQSQILIACLS